MTSNGLYYDLSMDADAPVLFGIECDLAGLPDYYYRSTAPRPGRRE
ncbi:MAG: hypothetical protein ACYC4R_11600 [Anaerolineae bacterium]